MGHVRPETLPTFTGFHTAVKFSDVGMVGGQASERTEREGGGGLGGTRRCG